MSKLDNLTQEERDQYNALLREIIKNTDPTDYMPPSVREVARMDMDTLKSEYELIVAKQSTRSSAQRRWIAERYVYESNKQQEQHDSAE
jgi:hypothetical protein